MRVIVDADSCPREARALIENACIRTQTLLVYAANKDIPFFTQSPLFSMTVCPQTQDAADSFILESATEQDLVVTRDIPLASRLVHKNITVINDRGTVFDVQNVSRMLEERELKLQMQSLGISPRVSFSSYGKKEKAAFAAALDRTLSAKLREIRR